jgi:hypothetical protein
MRARQGYVVTLSLSRRVDATALHHHADLSSGCGAASACRGRAFGSTLKRATVTGVWRVRETKMRAIVIAVLGLVAIALAGCASTRTRTAKAADRLERSADAFAARTCDRSQAACSPEYLPALPAAYAFADQARDFRRTLDSAGDERVVLAFERLWYSYHRLRNEVYRMRDPQLRADLKPTAKAFVDVQRHVKTGYSHADPLLYASGGLIFDPIYN